MSDLAPPGSLYVTELVAAALKGSTHPVTAFGAADLQGIGPVLVFRVEEAT